MDDFLTHINEPEVSNEDNLQLVKPITLKELTSIMNECKGTTPGPDGVNIIVYKAIWDIAGPIILNAWEYSCLTGNLSASQKESAICLLDKKGKDRRNVANLRPITLSNCDLKLITKTYTKRLDPVISKIINISQSAYISGRQVHDGLRLIDLIKEHSQRTKTSCFLTSLDAKKAYDSVSHEFIGKVLNKFGFANEFVNIFNILYKEIQTRVLVNGIQTEPIQIKRGVKQGDALSCSLFILLMETLTRKIEGSENIPNATINNQPTNKVIAYADDIAILTPEINGIKSALSIYESYSYASGLFINPEKTEIMNLKKDFTDTTINLEIYGKPNVIKLTNQITICGKTYANEKKIETENNISSKIRKLEKQINAWNKRNLTIEGKIKIIKTFGISQTLYTMQNTVYEPEHLKEIEKIIFKFIWNGKDKIKRSVLCKDYSEGGLKAPNIYHIDLTCKLKQLLRSAKTNHPIAKAQNVLIDLTQTHQNINKTNNGFIRTGLRALNMIGDNLDLEIKQCQTDEILHMHKHQISNIAGSKLHSIAKICKLNPIQVAYLKAEMKRDKINTLFEIY